MTARSRIAVERLKRVPPSVPVAAFSFGLLMAVAGRYGWHRDELYFFEAGRRLAWGYVDFPPGVAAIAAVVDTFFGESLVGFRFLSALAVGAVVLVTAAMARDLGGGRRAQLIAALGAGLSPVFLGVGHLVSTTTFELLAWSVLSWLVLRLLAAGDERVWPAVGLVVGVGFLVKHSMVFVVVALAAAIVSTGRSKVLGSRRLWSGVVVAALAAAPNVIWQAANDWPVFEMLGSLQDESEAADALLFLPAQLGLTGLTAVVWLPGLWWLLRGPETPWRPLAVAYLLLAGLFVVTSGKPYYLVGMYPVLLAAGGVWWEQRGGLRAPVVAVAVGAVALTMALPILPPEEAADIPVEDLELEFGAQLGWVDLVDDVASAHRSLGNGAVVVTSNYGTAGAVDLFGPERGLPPAHSPHNNYWLWGPPPDVSARAVVVGFSRDQVHEWFTACTLTSRFRTPHGVAAEEEGSPVWACTGQRRTWSDLWPELKAFRA